MSPLILLTISIDREGWIMREKWDQKLEKCVRKWHHLYYPSEFRPNSREIEVFLIRIHPWMFLWMFPLMFWYIKFLRAYDVSPGCSPGCSGTLNSWGVMMFPWMFRYIKFLRGYDVHPGCSPGCSGTLIPEGLWCWPWMFYDVDLHQKFSKFLTMFIQVLHSCPNL